jgi:hypothetical protein
VKVAVNAAAVAPLAVLVIVTVGAVLSLDPAAASTKPIAFILPYRQ